MFLACSPGMICIVLDDGCLLKLIHDAGRGDADAFQQLVVHYHTTLRAAVARRIGARIQARIDPDDVLQEAYIAAFEHLNNCEFEGPGGFYKWLQTIAINELNERIRALHRDKRAIDRELIQPVNVGHSSYQGLLNGVSAGYLTPSRHLRQSEAVAALMTSLARLKQEQRTVIRLRFLEGKPVRQIAEELGKNEARIYQLCHEGLTALRERMVSISRFLSGM